MRFAIFTHVEHKCEKQKYYVYAPYVREMNLWLKHIDEVEIVAPIDNRNELGNDLHYCHDKLTFRSIPAINFLSLKNSLISLSRLPIIFYRISQAMRSADHLHIRCPGNIGLLACFAQIFFPSKKKTVKYAGNWDPESKQPWTYNLQKWILKNRLLTRNVRVLIYGDWRESSGNIAPFFTASFSEKEKVSFSREFRKQWNFIVAGNLVQGKNPFFAVKLIEELKEAGQPVKLEIYGDGPLRKDLELYIEQKEMTDYVQLKGNRPLEELKSAYIRSDFAILPSRSEGWPKFLAEAMFFGCIPVSTAVSCVPWMLGNGQRGVLIEGDIKETAEKLMHLSKNPELMKDMSENAQAWSWNYTLERFEEEIIQLL